MASFKSILFFVYPVNLYNIIHSFYVATNVYANLFTLSIAFLNVDMNL